MDQAWWLLSAGSGNSHMVLTMLGLSCFFSQTSWYVGAFGDSQVLLIVADWDFPSTGSPDVSP